MNSSEIKHVPKGWGYEKWIVNTDEYCGKLLFFNEGKRCSWHYHKKKDETFYLQSGKIVLYYGETDSLEGAKDIVLVPGDKFPSHDPHRSVLLRTRTVQSPRLQSSDA